MSFIKYWYIIYRVIEIYIWNINAIVVNVAYACIFSSEKKRTYVFVIISITNIY